MSPNTQSSVEYQNEILKLIHERSLLPSEDLSGHAHEKGWINVSRGNWLNNMRPVGRVLDSKQRVILYEIQKSIIGGYLRELLEEFVADENLDPVCEG